MSARYHAIDWYDLPHYYEAVFSEDTSKEADFLEEMARRHGRRGTADVLEPACGGGRLLVAMARRGYRVAGFDANGEMLRHARRALSKWGRRAEVKRDTLEHFTLRRRFDMAHCLVSTFKYILDEAGAHSHLTAVARHLRTGGLYVLGFHLTEYGSRRKIRERWTASLGRSAIVCNIQIWPADRRKRLERVRSRLRVVASGVERRFETSWLFRTYDAAQVRRMLRAVPEFQHVATHDFAYDVGREIALGDGQLDIVLVLRKR